MYQFATFVFYMAVCWHKLGEVENKCTLHNSIVLALFAPKIIKIGEKLTKLWQKQFWLFSETRCTVWNAAWSKQALNETARYEE